jgi:hypothetical protein
MPPFFLGDLSVALYALQVVQLALNENHDRITVVAPTGFGHDASAFELKFEGLALAA